MNIKNNRLWRIITLLLFFCAYWMFTQPDFALQFGSSNIELRFSGFLPIVCGLIFGLPGAIACACANFLFDIFNNFTAADVFGTLGVFLMGYLPYKLWHTLFRMKDSPPEFLYSGTSVLKFAAVAFVSGGIAAAIGGVGGEITGEYSFAQFFSAVMPQYYILSVICGMLLFSLLIRIPFLYPKIPLCAYKNEYKPARYIPDYLICGVCVCVMFALAMGLGSQQQIKNILLIVFLICSAYATLSPIARSKTPSGLSAVYYPRTGLRSRFIIAFLILLLTVTVFYMLEIIPHFMREVLDSMTFFDNVLRNVSIYASVMLLILFFMLKWLGDKVTKPLISISEYAENFIVGGNMESHALVIKPTGTEIDSLAQSINTMSADIKKYAETEKARVKQEAQRAAEMRAAAAIQLNMLPNPTAVCHPFKIGAYIKPARDVGGDLYDFAQGEDGLFTAVADVSGKGITAALFMIRAKTLLNTDEPSNVTQSLSQLVTHLNGELTRGNDSLMFVTMFAAYLNAKDKTATYVNAGHNPPLFWDGVKTNWCDANASIALGINDKAIYSEGTLPIYPGFKLLLYTDGVTEAQNETGEFFGENRLMSAANKAFIQRLYPQDIVDFIKDELNAFIGEAPQFDDITLLCAEYLGE